MMSLQNISVCLCVNLIINLSLSGNVHSKTIQNTNYWFGDKFKDQRIHLFINNKKYELKENITEITKYYTTKSLVIKKSGKRSNLSCAKKIKEGLYLVRPNEYIKLPNNLDWSADPLNDRNWRFSYHSLKFMKCLHLDVDAFINAPFFLKKIKSIILDWSNDNFTTDPPDDEFSWNDHTIALRLGVVLGFWETLRENDALDEEIVYSILRFIYWHTRILLEEKSIRYDYHNHGLDQAYNTFMSSVVLPELIYTQDAQNIALVRLKAEVEHMMVADGVHTENSLGYQMWVPQHVSNILQKVKYYLGIDLSDKLMNFENKALRFVTLLTQPNGFLPEIGDTLPGLRPKMKFNKIHDLSYFPYYLYAKTRGKKGKKPIETVSVWPESGYFSYRNKWDFPGQDTAFHLVMKCGFLANGHRHDDDGNLLLYSSGEPWFIDGGMYGYVGESEIERKYVRSPYAHNVSIPENVKVNRSLTQKNKKYKNTWGITAHDLGENKEVECSSHMYDGFLYKRKLTVNSDNTFNIRDDFKYEGFSFLNLFKKNDYLTQFRFPDNKIIIIYNDRVEVISNSGLKKLEILFDRNEVKNISVRRGKDHVRWSLKTKDWKEFEEVKTLVFKLRNSEVNFSLRFLDIKKK